MPERSFEFSRTLHKPARGKSRILVSVGGELRFTALDALKPDRLYPLDDYWHW